MARMLKQRKERQRQDLAALLCEREALGIFEVGIELIFQRGMKERRGEVEVNRKEKQKICYC